MTGVCSVPNPVRVANFVAKMEKKAGIIAHSCGVAKPRRLRRFHCRIVEADRRSVPMNELYLDTLDRSRRSLNRTAVAQGGKNDKNSGGNAL
jgi:hypothetical protein